MELVFEREKETKNTVRFQEVVADGGRPVIGPLYVQKSWLADNDAETLEITIQQKTSERTLTTATDVV
jgi:hypothetical protein